DAAGRGGDVEDRRILRIDLQVVDASARRGGTDVAEVQRVERRPSALRARAGGRERDEESERGQRDDEGETSEAAHSARSVSEEVSPRQREPAMWSARLQPSVRPAPLA